MVKDDKNLDNQCTSVLAPMPGASRLPLIILTCTHTCGRRHLVLIHNPQHVVKPLRLVHGQPILFAPRMSDILTIALSLTYRYTLSCSSNSSGTRPSPSPALARTPPMARSRLPPTRSASLRIIPPTPSSPLSESLRVYPSRTLRGSLNHSKGPLSLSGPTVAVRPRSATLKSSRDPLPD